MKPLDYFQTLWFPFKSIDQVKLKKISKIVLQRQYPDQKKSQIIFSDIVLLTDKQWEKERFLIGIQGMRLSPWSRSFPPRHHSLPGLILGQSLLVTFGSTHWGGDLTIAAFKASMVMMLLVHFFCFSKSRGNCAWIGCFNIRRPPRRKWRLLSLDGLFFILFFLFFRQFFSFNLFGRRFRRCDTKSA